MLLCCYTDLRPETFQWIVRHYPPWARRLVYVAGDDYAYGRILRAAWRALDDLLVVEHDVVPPDKAADELEFCPEPYCAVPYAWSTCVGPALGCTRFRKELLLEYPEAMELACAVPSSYGKPGHYRQLDVFLMRRVLRDIYGLQPHVHLPAAVHLNETLALRPDADPTPVLDVRGIA